MTVSEFMKFVDGQRDSRLNEILFPFCNAEKAQELITKYEPNQFNVKVRKKLWPIYAITIQKRWEANWIGMIWMWCSLATNRTSTYNSFPLVCSENN